MNKLRLAQRRNRAKWLLLGGNIIALNHYKDVLTKTERKMIDRMLKHEKIMIRDWDKNSSSLGLNPLKTCETCGIKMKTKKCKICDTNDND